MLVVAVVYLVGAALVAIAGAACAVLVCVAAIRSGTSQGMLASLVGAILLKAVLIAPLWPLGVVALVLASIVDYADSRRGLASEY